MFEELQGFGGILTWNVFGVLHVQTTEMLSSCNIIPTGGLPYAAKIYTGTLWNNPA